MTNIIKKYATPDQAAKFNWAMVAIEEGFLTREQAYAYAADIMKEGK